MEKQNLVINGKSFKFEEGHTILDAAKSHGIEIPTLCYLKDTTPTGACRICMVEIENQENLVPACSTPAAHGMKIYTDSPKVRESRRMNIQLLLASGSHNCLVQGGDSDSWTDIQLKAMEAPEHKEICPSYGNCRLQDLAIKYRVRAARFAPSAPEFPADNLNPFIIRDFSRCILCGRCVQACNEVIVNEAISLGFRGTESRVITRGDVPLHESDCVFCGQCVEVCPVGALIEKKALKTGYECGSEKVRTTCPYCGVGCQMWLHVSGGKIKKVSAVEEGSPNKGRLCVKGRFGYDFIYSEDRLKTPLIRENNGFRPASWDEALDLVADRFRDIIGKHGPDSVAGVSCARSINEDSYQMQKLFRAVFKTNNIDHCART